LIYRGKTEIDIINEYLALNHCYRTGKISAANRAYMLDAIVNDNIESGLGLAELFNEIVEKDFLTKDVYLQYLQDGEKESGYFI
jgi:hypothetical protein